MRTYGAAPRRLARPLTVEEIRQIVGGIQSTTPIGIRDAAIILLGYASAMRRAEIVALTLLDIEHKPAGLLLNIRASKMDQEGHGQVVAVAHGQHASTDPVAALAAWRVMRGRYPVHCSPGSGRARAALRSAVGLVVARMLRAVPWPPDSTAPGSRRTPCAPATPPPQLWPVCRSIGSPPRPGTKSSPSHVNRYIRPLEALATTSSKGLGL